MSKHIDGMKIGDCLDIMGPTGAFTYEKLKFKHYGLIAGGTGITPIIQIIRNITADKTDPTRLTTLYANNTEADILLRDELDSMVENHKGKLKITHVLAQVPPTSHNKYETGYITKEIIQRYLPAPSKDHKILICGPPPMERAIISLLKEMNYTPDMYFSFTQVQKDSIAEESSTIDKNQEYTMEEIAKHNHEKDVWLVIRGDVYDATKFVNEHPGGLIILDGAGKDATSFFTIDFPHSEEAEAILQQFKIGVLKKS